MFFRHLTFLKIFFFCKNLSGTLSVSNSLDPDQDRHSVNPDLGTNCLQRLPAVTASKEQVNMAVIVFYK